MFFLRVCDRQRLYKAAASVLLAVFLLSSLSVALADHRKMFSKKTVLILNSYHKSYKWTDNILDGIFAVMGGDTGGEYELLVEDMDTKRVSEQDLEYQEKLFQVYRYKFASRHLDAIIVSDDPAFLFMLRYGEILFPEVPVIFCGVNYFEESMIQGRSNYTGVVEAVDVRQTLDVALALNPAARTVYLVNDTTITGQNIRRNVLEAVQQYQDLNFISLEDLSLEQLAKKLQRLNPQEDIVLFLVLFQDVTGRYYSYDEAITRLSAASAVPIYGLWDFHLGHGLVGGRLTSGYQQGMNAALMCRRVLEGESPGAILPLTKSPNQYMFDDRQLKKFQLPVAKLPGDSVIINQSFKEKDLVLLLHSYNPEMTWTKNIEAGVVAEFADKKGVELYIDYMDAKRNPSPEYLQRLYETYRTKYGNKKFDAIMVSDDFAYAFILNYHEELFPGVPVTFCGVNNYLPEQRAGREDWLTGVEETIDVRGTLALIERLQPQVREVVVINDKTGVGRTNRRLLDVVMPEFSERLRFTQLDGLKMTEVQDKVATLGPESAILLLSFNQDQSNNIFSYEESIERIAEKAAVPIYGVWDFYLGRGLTGGMLTSGYFHGQLMAQMTQRILSGTSPREIPVIRDSPNRNMVDYEQMQRHKLALWKVPEETVIVNRPVSFYEQNRRMVWSVGGFIAIQTGVIFLLYINIRARRRVQEELREYATTDQMTGVFNRRTGMVLLAEQIALAGRQGEGFVICFADVDGLKYINDTYGHAAGDQWIRTVSDLLRRPLRATDAICRMGGDEFLLLLPFCDEGGAQKLLARIEDELVQYNQENPFREELRVSFGLAAYDPNQPVALEELLSAADQAMYQNKFARKNRRSN